jgi:eukaryotic-like serine/threonine-protein kinase
MTLEAGTLINQNVRLVRMLGQGAMGAIWLADHLTLHTQVAVKFILADHTGDAETVDRFTREATSAAKIKSPNVVQIFDHGLFEGLPYIVMELLEGEDLDVRLTRAPLALGELGSILQQVGKALAQAHTLGIVHRDIKPANVFLTTAGDDLLVKLLDFGVAKTTRGPGDAVFKTTQTGQIIGTPCFMSPEVLFSRGVIDHRVDLWALGVLVYEALTGELPFAGNSVGDVYLAIDRGTFRAPSSLDRSLPGELDAWFTRVFAHDVDARFSSARALCDAFLAIAARAPTARRSRVNDVNGVFGSQFVASGQERRATPGGTGSSDGSRKAARSKIVVSVIALAAVAGACAVAIAVLGHPPSILDVAAASPAASPVAAAPVIAEPPALATASVAIPEIVPAQPSPPSAAPSVASPAPRVKATRPATAPTGTSKSRDHGF